MEVGLLIQKRYTAALQQARPLSPLAPSCFQALSLGRYISVRAATPASIWGPADILEEAAASSQ